MRRIVSSLLDFHSYAVKLDYFGAVELLPLWFPCGSAQEHTAKAVTKICRLYKNFRSHLRSL